MFVIPHQNHPKAMDIPFIEVLTIDPKTTSKKMIQMLSPSQHHFDFMDDVLQLVNNGQDSQEGHEDEARALCSWHNKDVEGEPTCCMPQQGAHMMVLGSPCAPFSGQRVGRFSQKGSEARRRGALKRVTWHRQREG